MSGKRRAQMHPRLLFAFLTAAGLTACSGNIGGGQSTLPGTPQGTTNTQQVAAAPTASPVSASNVATVSDTVAAQPLPAVMGWGGTIEFPKPVAAPSASPDAKASPVASATPQGPISVGVTAAVVEPSDAPHLDTKARHAGGKHADSSGLKGLLYITLLATQDVTLGEYPKIAFDVPREIAAQYRERTLALALFDPATKEKVFRLAVAERDLASPAPGGTPVAKPTPQALPTGPASDAPGAAAAFTPPPIGTGLDAGTLPPERVAFLAPAQTLSLKANRPLVFALYAAAVQPTPSPSPSSGAPMPSPSPSATASPQPSPTASVKGTDGPA